MQYLDQSLVQQKNRTYLYVVSSVLAITLIIILIIYFSSEKITPGQLRSESYASAKKGDFKDTVDKLNEYLKTKPGDVEAINMLAVSYAQIGETKKALAATEDALKKRPGDPDILYRAGLLASELKDYRKAISYIGKAQKAKPEMIQTHYVLAGIFSKAKEYDRAIEEWDYVLKHLKMDKKQQATIYGNLGNLYLKKQDYDKAKEVLKKGLTIDPTNKNLKAQMAEITR